MKEYKELEKCEIILSKEMAKQLNILKEIGFTPQNCKLSSFVFESDRYDILENISPNREIKDRYVKSKKDILQNHGFNSSNPIIIGKNGKLLDGQHRTLASKELGINFKFTIDSNIEEKDYLKFTIDVNNTIRKWNISDYIYAYKINNKVSYIKLYDLRNELNISLNKILILHYNEKITSKHLNIIKEGNFSLNNKDIEKIKEKLSLLEELKVLTNKEYKKLINSDDFYVAFTNILQKENFNFKTLKKQFVNDLYMHLDETNLTESLIDVYNFNRKNKIKK